MNIHVTKDQQNWQADTVLFYPHALVREYLKYGFSFKVNTRTLLTKIQQRLTTFTKWNCNTMALLFDLDGTLLDDLAAKKHYIPKLYSHFQNEIRYNMETFFRQWAEAIPKYYKMYTDGFMTFEEQRRERIREAFGNPDLPEQKILEVVNAFDTYFKEGWKPFYNTIEILEHFKDEKLGIITNGSSKSQNEKIDMLRIRHYFKCIIISGEELCAKPDKEIFFKACEKLSCTPSECTFIGDSWESDVVGSNNCGMNSVWINHYGKDLPYTLERFHMITDLKELKNIVKKMKDKSK